MLTQIYLEDEKKKKHLPILYKSIFIFTGLILGFLLSRIFFMTITVKDSSMIPNLEKGDRALVLKIISPDIGDIVLLNSPVEPEKVLFKRLVARGGDVMEIKDKIIYKNFEKLKLNWHIHCKDERLFPADFSNRDNLPSVGINDGECFVLGDNLDRSFDSRDFGAISEENIIGRVIFKY